MVFSLSFMENDLKSRNQRNPRTKQKKRKKNLKCRKILNFRCYIMNSTYFYQLFAAPKLFQVVTKLERTEVFKMLYMSSSTNKKSELWTQQPLLQWSESGKVNFISVDQGMYVAHFLCHCYADVHQCLLASARLLYLKMQKADLSDTWCWM